MSFKTLRSLRLCGESLFILTFFFLFVFSCNVLAEDIVSESEAYDLEEIVVTATRSETPKQDVAANITVITREDIEGMPVSNAAEVLQYIPGVYVEFNGGLGSDATAVRIQGSETRHVGVFQDGVPLNQLATPRTNLSFIPIDTIDRIEIYKGAASSAWGSALGGVINIITKEPARKKPFTADVRTSYGEFETFKSRGTFSGTIDGFGYLLSLTHDESDGFLENTEYEQNAIYGKINYDLGSKSRLNLACSYNEGRDAAYYPISYPDEWDDVYPRRTYQRLLFETRPADNLGLTIEGRHHRFRIRYDVVNVYSNQRTRLYDYVDEIWGVSAVMSYHSSEINALNLGFDGDWGRYCWTGYSEKYETRNWAAYTNDTLTVGDFAFNAGIRYDHNKDFGSKLSPSVGAVYRISGNDALVRAQIARGFSAPEASWVHDPTYGNPDLEPELATNYQLGAEVQPFKFLRLELNLFRADIRDLIEEDPITYVPYNIDEVTRKGVEGSISATFDFGLKLMFGGSYVDVRNKQTDETIPDIPSKIFNVSAAYTYKWMTHSITGKYIDHNSTYAETRDEVFVLDYLLKADLPFPERHGKASLFAAVYNLTNTTYLYRGDWPQPDRWFEGGVRFEF